LTDRLDWRSFQGRFPHVWGFRSQPPWRIGNPKELPRTALADLHQPERFDREELLFAVYGLLAGVFSVLMFVYAVRLLEISLTGLIDAYKAKRYQDVLVHSATLSMCFRSIAM